MTFPTAYADSDADDEYERSVMTSPILATDDDTSPTDSDPPSNQHTPTTFGNHVEPERLSPRSIITAWSTQQCADYISTLGLSQYCEKFKENEIVGEALIALKHDELKEMGITSVGHRLTILKGVYDVKVRQDVPIDSDHYISLSADASIHEQTATRDDIQRIIQSIKMRDERIQQAEAELRKVQEDYRKLRDDLLPVFRMAKDRSQPLPYQPGGNSPDLHGYEGMTSPMPPIQSMPEKIGSSLSRKFSNKKLFLGSAPKNSSPTHVPHSIPEGKALSDNSNLDPSAAAMLASSHLTNSANGGSQPSSSPNQATIPSPTSPNTTYTNQPTLASRSYARDPRDGRERDNRDARDGRSEGSTPNTARSIYSHGDDSSAPPSSMYSQTSTTTGDRDRMNPTPTPGNVRERRPQPRDQEEVLSSAASTAPSIDMPKKFRVSMEDPCHKVLPAALKKYNINADWRQYALYIVHGDQERCLGLEEKPLILFKQLDRDGRKPMFMLRRHAAPIEGHSGPSGFGTSGYMDGGLGSLRGHSSSIQLPGGVL